MCSKPFKLLEVVKKQPLPEPASGKPPLKMNFKEFEAGKRKLNRLWDNWAAMIDTNPESVSKIKKLRFEIDSLREGLEQNSHHALRFKIG